MCRGIFYDFSAQNRARENEKSRCRVPISNVTYDDKDNLGPISYARRARTAYNLHECVMIVVVRSPAAHSGKVPHNEGE